MRRIGWRAWPRAGDGRTPRLPATERGPHAPGMFMLTEADAAAIRAAFEPAGELPAADELWRRCPGVADIAHARHCARIISGWRPAPAEDLSRLS